MVALSKDRPTPYRNGEDYSDPVGAGAKLYAGSLVALNAAGWAVAAATATTLKARGVAQTLVDNTGGANGAKAVPTRAGLYKFVNLAADPITRADIGNDAFIVDDQTVARTNGTSTRSTAGKVRDVESDGVWIAIGI